MKNYLITGFGKGFMHGAIIALLFSSWALRTTLYHYPNPELFFFAFFIFFTFINTIVLGVIFSIKERQKEILKLRDMRRENPIFFKCDINNRDKQIF